MNTDSFFTIGGPHISACDPCQDYALSGILANGVAYALVSDGSSCAGSGVLKGQTDIGSRLISHAFVSAINCFPKTEIVNAIVSGAVQKLMIDQVSRTRYTTNENDLLATLVAVVTDGVMAATLCIGDGVIVVNRNDQETIITELIWNASMPYYPAYSILGRDDQFIDHHNALACDGFSFIVNKITINGQNIILKNCSEHSAQEIVFSPFVDIFLIDGVQSITVFSDGISQISSNLNLTDVVKKLTGFKNTKGRFVARRAHSALTKDFIEPLKDDFSMAGIWIGD